LTGFRSSQKAGYKEAEPILARMKRVVVAFPEDILAGIDDIVVETNKTRSLFIREACCFYMEKVKKENMREQMINGYLEMAEINRLLAEEIACDFDCFPRWGPADEYSALAPDDSRHDVSARWRKT
jgi:CopG family transcriptional regulator/antitoxin EndoAI